MQVLMVKGDEYAAALHLSPFEKMAGTSPVASAITSAGFSNVHVWFDKPQGLPPLVANAPHANAWARGTWQGPTRTVDPAQVNARIVAVAAMSARPAPPVKLPPVTHPPPVAKPPGPPSVTPSFPTNIAPALAIQLNNIGALPQGTVMFERGQVWVASFDGAPGTFEQQFFSGGQVLSDEQVDGAENPEFDLCNGYVIQGKAARFFRGVYEGGPFQGLVPSHWKRALLVGHGPVWTTQSDPNLAAEQDQMAFCQYGDEHDGGHTTPPLPGDPPSGHTPGPPGAAPPAVAAKKKAPWGPIALAVGALGLGYAITSK